MDRILLLAKGYHLAVVEEAAEGEERGILKSNFRDSRRLQRILRLPLYPDLTKREQQRVITLLKKCL